MHDQPEQRPFFSRRDAAAVALLWAVTLAFFWPMLRDPLHTFVGVFGNKGDAEGTLWWNWWVGTALRDPTLSLWHTTSMFFPIGKAVAPLYGSVQNVLFHLPFLWTLPQPLANNLWCLTIALTDAAVAYFVFRAFARHRGLALVGAVLWALAPYKFLEFRDGHLPQILLTFVPLAAWALWRLRERRTWSAALLAGVALLLDACGYYQHMYGAFFLAVWLTVAGAWALRRERQALRRYLAQSVAVAGIVLLGAAMFYAPLATSVASGQDAPWAWPDSFPSNDRLQDQPMHILILQYGTMHLTVGSQKLKISVEQLFLAALAAAALAVAVWSRRVRLWAAIAAFFTLIAVGPVPYVASFDAHSGWSAWVFRNPVYIGLFNYFPSFNRLYWPDTFWPYAVFALAMTTVLGLREPLASGKPARAGVAGGLAVALVALTLWASVGFVRTSPFVGPFFDRATTDVLARADGRAFFTLPTQSGDDYALPLVVLTGKAMIGGRGRDLGYIEPPAFTALVRDDPWLAALHGWSRMDDTPQPSAEALAPWLAQGARHVVINRNQCRQRDGHARRIGRPVGLEVFLRERLEPRCGSPIAVDADWLIYELR